MAAPRDVALAQLASAAYADTPTGLPPGFTALSAAALTLPANAAYSFSNGEYRNQNAAALVTTGFVDGKATVVIAFRGSDDRTDSLNDLRNINADLPKFAPLTAQVEAYALSIGAQVYFTGHSLGGSMAQLAIAASVDTQGVKHFADTFGSAGALQTGGGDARVTNFITADDPAVWLGMNRKEIGDQLQGNSILTDLVAQLAKDAFPGITAQDARDSVSFLTQDYVNRGVNIILPDAHGNTAATLSVLSLLGSLLGADPSEHKVALYVQKLFDSTPHFTAGRGAEPLFDAGFYLAKQADVVAARVDAQTHFDTSGWHEGRDPNALFATNMYLSRNADVAAAKIDPLSHYEQFGWHEGRDPIAAFQVKFYLGQNPDVAASGAEPLLHFIQFGAAEGRNPDPYFDVNYYLSHNADVAGSGINALAHFEAGGWREGRDPGPGFSVSSYLLHNPDVAAAQVNPLDHYLLSGINEHRLL